MCFIICCSKRAVKYAGMYSFSEIENPLGYIPQKVFLKRYKKDWTLHPEQNDLPKSARICFS